MPGLADPLAFPLGGGGTVVLNTLCDVWGSDLIAVTFASAVKNNATLQLRDTYLVTPLDGGADVTVTGVQTGNTSNTTTVWLIVTAPEIGKTYAVTFGDLLLVDGIGVSPNVCKFIGRSTKQDTIVHSRPTRYDMVPDALYRKILNALGRQDDLIGGSRSDFFTSYIPAIPAITLSVSPDSAFIHLNATQTFVAAVTGTPNTNVYWYVNDVLGGNSTVGTVDSSGNYTAPSAAAGGAISVVKAVAQIDNTVVAEASVTFNQT